MSLLNPEQIKGLSSNPVQIVIIQQLSDIFDPADNYDIANYVAAIRKFNGIMIAQVKKNWDLTLEEPGDDFIKLAMNDWVTGHPDEEDELYENDCIDADDLDDLDEDELERLFDENWKRDFGQ